MRSVLIVSVFALAGCGTNRCVTGQSTACACVDGKMGAQTCQADGTFGSCQCGTLACNSTNCASGCCDATGACNAGTATSACGTGAASCIACGVGQTCTSGSCRASNVGGGNGATGGGNGSTGGGSGTECAPGGSPCAGCCMGSACIQSQASCGINGAACQTCTAQQLCSNTGTCIAPKRVFVTGTTYNGSLGGITGADQKCATAAQAANLGGTWKAWISDANTNAIDRITEVGPWYGRQFGSFRIAFNNKANLETTPQISVNRDELGDENSADIWTGTGIGGIKTNATCSNWALGTSGTTGTVGTGEDQRWTSAYAAECSTLKGVLCLEQ